MSAGSTLPRALRPRGSVTSPFPIRRRHEPSFRLRPRSSLTAHHRLDRVLIADIDPRTGEQRRGFETEEDVLKEDLTRAVSLMKTARMPAWRPGASVWLRFPNWGDLDPAKIRNLAERLNAGYETGVHCKSLASAFAMRDIRVANIGSVLESFERYSDDELCTFTVLNSNWVFDAPGLQAVSAADLKKQFRYHLRRIGIYDIPGPFIAYLHGEFEPTSGRFTLHFHGGTTLEKYKLMLKLLRTEWGYVKTASGATPIRMERVRDRVRQFSYLLKSFWPQRSFIAINDEILRKRTVNRIQRPFLAISLLWLDVQKLSDMMVLQGCRFTPGGELRLL